VLWLGDPDRKHLWLSLATEAGEEEAAQDKRKSVEEDAMIELVSTYISLSCLYTIFVQGSRV
jgi:hypothetical protein